jgi:hypothetical protein
MSLEIASGAINTIPLPSDNISSAPAEATNLKRPAATPPPPPPPPPPPTDAVQLSLEAKIHQLVFQGDSPSQIEESLNVSPQILAVYLGTSLLQAALTAAPTTTEQAGNTTTVNPTA